MEIFFDYYFFLPLEKRLLMIELLLFDSGDIEPNAKIR